MPADIVIRGGTVFDGSGAPGRAADVAIEGRVIREIGPNLRGERELDASGCAVAPGFIDIHTHYDAQVFWDPALTPSSYHGITTVVAGNCGFTLAPTRPEHHDVIVRTLENVEDMDPATLAAGVSWDFETFPEYLESIRRRGTTLNFTAYIGHSALRLYVMGDAAYERAATAEEIEYMCRLVREAIDAGAAGFSTSFSYAHRGVDGKPVPSRFAEGDEVEALFLAAGQTGKGMVLITPGKQCSYADVYEWQPRVGRPFTYPLFAAPGGKHLEPVELHEQGLARGADVWAPGHAAAAHDAVHDGGRVQPQHRDGVRRAAEGGAPGAPRCVPRSRVARAGVRGSGELTDEAALGDLRGLGVGTVPRAPRTARDRPRA
jgi:N-acyl-D-amino-acid deacylase